MDVVVRTNSAHAETMKETLHAFREKLGIFPFDSPKKTPNKPLYEYNLAGALCYSTLPPKEFFESEKAIEDFRLNPPVNNDPTYDQQQNDLLCRQFFTKIQNIREELADHVLVEPMAVTSICYAGFWGHLNFKAKHKDAADSSSAIYFAELDVINNKVTRLIKLDIDLSADTSAYKRCAYCHQPPEAKDVPSSGVGCVYHPVEAKLFLK